MKDISLQITSSDDKSILTLKTIGTNWGDFDISSVSVNTYGEDKETPLFTYDLDAQEIIDLQDITDGLQAAAESIIPGYTANDNFYSITVNVTETDDEVSISNWVAIAYTFVIEALFRDKSINDTWESLYGVNNKVADNVMRSITHVNGHFFLERLDSFGTAALYTYDREIGWRKIYQVMDTYYGN